MYTATPSVSQFFAKYKDKKGKVKTFRIVVRKIILENTGKVSIIEPERFQITKIYRKSTGETYSVKGLFQPNSERFQTLNLDFRSAPKPTWKYLENGLRKSQIVAWLKKWLRKTEQEIQAILDEIS